MSSSFTWVAFVAMVSSTARWRTWARPSITIVWRIDCTCTVRPYELEFTRRSKP